MVDTPHGDFPPTSSEQIARSLLQSARQDPALLGRSHPPRVSDPGGDRWDLPFAIEFRRPLQLPAPYALGRIAEPDLEDLVSIAVVSAHQAEDAVREAREATGAVRRGRVLYAGLGVLGLLAGMAAIADNHLHGILSATMVPPEAATVAAAAPEPPQGAVQPPVETASLSQTPLGQAPQSAGQIPQFVAEPPHSDAAPPQPVTALPVAASRPVAALPQPGNATNVQTGIDSSPMAPVAVAANPVIPAASAQLAAHPIVPPVYHAPMASNATTWPTRPSVHYYASAPARRVVVPSFFVALRRDVSALFRGFPPHS